MQLVRGPHSEKCLHKASRVALDLESSLRKTRSRTRFSLLNCVLRTLLAFRGALAMVQG